MVSWAIGDVENAGFSPCCLPRGSASLQFFKFTRRKLALTNDSMTYRLK